MDIINLIINSMEQNPSWEGKNHSSSQEFFRLLLNKKINLSSQEPASFSILCQKNPAHNHPSYFSMFHSF